MVKKRLNLVKFIYTVILSLIFIIVPNAGAHAYAESKYYLGGYTAGFLMNTSTIEVVGLCDIPTKQGLCCPSKDAGICNGDKIIKINNISVQSISEISSLMNTISLENEISLLINRKGEYLSINLLPVLDNKLNKISLGLLLKDTVSGIGTVTYIEENGNFSAIGHPIADCFGYLYPIKGGTVHLCNIYDVKKGARGKAGELCGIINYNNMIGVMSENSSNGIKGKIKDNIYKNKTSIEIGDATIGDAKIYSTVRNNERKEYAIQIVKVDEHEINNKNLVIKVNDKLLLETTGGIVQGMSGSPIVQNGKLVGAVTHVFINDPTRGFGISIKNMIDS